MPVTPYPPYIPYGTTVAVSPISATSNTNPASWIIDAPGTAFSDTDANGYAVSLSSGILYVTVPAGVTWEFWDNNSYVYYYTGTTLYYALFIIPGPETASLSPLGYNQPPQSGIFYTAWGQGRGLDYNFYNAVTVTIDNGVGDVSPAPFIAGGGGIGSVYFNAYQATTFTMTVTGFYRTFTITFTFNIRSVDASPIRAALKIFPQLGSAPIGSTSFANGVIRLGLQASAFLTGPVQSPRSEQDHASDSVTGHITLIKSAGGVLQSQQWEGWGDLAGTPSRTSAPVLDATGTPVQGQYPSLVKISGEGRYSVCYQDAGGNVVRQDSFDGLETLN